MDTKCPVCGKEMIGVYEFQENGFTSEAGGECPEKYGDRESHFRYEFSYGTTTIYVFGNVFGYYVTWPEEEKHIIHSTIDYLIKAYKAYFERINKEKKE